MKKLHLPIGGDPSPAFTPDPTPQLTELVLGDQKFNVNVNGDAIGDDGKILKTKDELEKLKTTSIPPVNPDPKSPTPDPTKEKQLNDINAQLIEGAVIELDGENHTLDKDGNIIKDGKVIKTKKELAELILTNTSPSAPVLDDDDYVGNIQKATNLVIVTPDNKPIEYENTLPGITRYVLDVHKNGRELGANEFQETLLSQFPVLKDVIEHLTLTGSLKGFNEEVDYNSVVLSDDENQQIDIYTKAQIARGVSPSEINDLVKYLKEDKKLKLHAEHALNYLKTTQTEHQVSRAQAIKDAQLQEEREIDEYWNNIDSTLKSKEVVIKDKKFTLPEVIRVKEADGKIVTKSLKDFEDYVKKPRNFNIDGKLYTMTQHDYDEYLENIERTPQHDLFDAFRRFSKYDDSQLIAANASSNVVKKVIKLKSKVGGGSGANAQGGKIVLPIK